MVYTDAVAADEVIAVFFFETTTGTDLTVSEVPSALLTVEERVAYSCGIAMCLSAKPLRLLRTAD
eukprot:COSAG02_NODE_20028_length_851_cov_1.461436_1_plen_65_part_00